ncbi:hypothetical protein AB0I28_36785 [Phytomonospora sp. NPDC050363]|uniref:hypothetical protein n=1 Tax=Phytomonospora sp. NPDC050363 TaxID=3155642 RepID=UPI0033C4A3BC
MSGPHTPPTPSPGSAGEPAKKPVRARKAVQKVAEAGGKAAEQAQEVAEEVTAKARKATAELRETVVGQARNVTDGIAENAEHIADELDKFTAGHGDSPARTVVTTVSTSGRQVADYLREKGPEGVLNEAKRLIRRYPAAFVVAALVGGFILGRNSKGSSADE